MGDIDLYKQELYSPRKRGRSFRDSLTSGYHGVFPAQAGVIPYYKDVKAPTMSIPRASGGDPEKPEWLTMDQMYSPRKRGCFS